MMWIDDLGLQPDFQSVVLFPSGHQGDLFLQDALLVSPVLAGYLYSSLECGVNSLDPERGGPPGRRGRGKTGQVFAQSMDIWNCEDDLIAVVTLQETGLD